MVIDGRKIAEEMIADLKKKPASKKILAAVLVGNNSASQSFLNQKAKVAERLGVQFKVHAFQDGISEIALEHEMLKIIRDDAVGGVILQLPLPKGFNRERLMRLIPKEKDVDSLNNSPLVLAPTVGAVKSILDYLHFDLDLKRAVVVGRGLLVGEPIAEWLRKANTHLSITDQGNLDIDALREADIVAVGIGSPSAIKGDMVKRGSIVIDFGFSMKDGKVLGDVDFETVSKKAGFVTPTPGGTGPIVVAELFANFFTLSS